MRKPLSPKDVFRAAASRAGGSAPFTLFYDNLGAYHRHGRLQAVAHRAALLHERRQRAGRGPVLAFQVHAEAYLLQALSLIHI